jgi:hypothetical protein
MLFGINKSKRVYNCCGEAEFEGHLNIDLVSLTIQGLILDGISHRTLPPAFTQLRSTDGEDEDGTNAKDMLSLLKWLVRVRNWARLPEVASLLGEEWSDKIWRTAIAYTGTDYSTRGTEPLNMSGLEATMDFIQPGSPIGKLCSS